MRFFGTDKRRDKDIEDLILEVQIKFNPKQAKLIKGNKTIARKELVKQIEKSQKSD